MSRVCANCEEEIAGEPYEADGESFCCSGCAAGGPCECTYNWAPPSPQATNTAVELLRSQLNDSADAHQLAWPAPAPAPAAAPLRQRPLILRVAGLTNQLDLLRLGSALEAEPAIEDLSLVRADLEDVWFAATVRSPDALADALVRLDGFEVDARPHPAGVDATVTARPAGIESNAAPRIATAEPPRIPVPLFRPEERLTAIAEAMPPAIEQERAATAAPISSPASAAAAAGGTMLSAADRPGGAVLMREHITLIAYPFRSFVALNEFQDALRALHGVINVKVRRFYRGTLHLGVEYEDVIPLAERLHDLDSVSWRLVSTSPQEIELMLEEQGDLVSSG